MLATEPTDRTQASEPAEPMDRIEPAEPTDKMDPLDPMDRIDPLEPMLRIDPDEPAEREEPLLIPMGPLFRNGEQRFRPRRAAVWLSDRTLRLRPGVMAVNGAGSPERRRRPREIAWEDTQGTGTSTTIRSAKKGFEND